MLELKQRCVVMCVSKAWRRAALERPELWRVLDLVAPDAGVSDRWMAAWVHQGEARAEVLAPFLAGRSVAETFAEFAAYDDETLRGGKEGMQEAIKEGEAENTGSGAQALAIARAHLRTRCQLQRA